MSRIYEHFNSYFSHYYFEIKNSIKLINFIKKIKIRKYLFNLIWFNILPINFFKIFVCINFSIISNYNLIFLKIDFFNLLYHNFNESKRSNPLAILESTKCKMIIYFNTKPYFSCTVVIFLIYLKALKNIVLFRELFLCKCWFVRILHSQC